MTNTALFKSTLVLKGITMKDLAKKIGMSYPTLSYKINNLREFSTNEAKKVQKALEIDNDLCLQIFFEDDVEKKSTN
ncbi:MAG: helix-turn-helix domain-containing protein [Anaerorhabdus sp.]|uniref:helix-turn-helix domain-containing protein n=1 Tax=Anaerorhabdus sp. TaxID=1872524 RepID=UPI003A8B6A6E